MPREARDAAPRGFDPSKPFRCVADHLVVITPLTVLPDGFMAVVKEPLGTTAMQWGKTGRAEHLSRNFDLINIEPDPFPAAAGQESDAVFVNASSFDGDDRAWVPEMPREAYDRLINIARRAVSAEAERDRLRSELAARTGKQQMSLADQIATDVCNDPFLVDLCWLKAAVDYPKADHYARNENGTDNLARVHGTVQEKVCAALEAAAPFMPAESSLLPGLRRAREKIASFAWENVVGWALTAIDDEIAAVLAQTEQERHNCNMHGKYNEPECPGCLYGADATEPAPQAPSTSCGATDEQLRSIKRNEWLHCEGGAIEVFALRDEVLRLRNQPSIRAKEKGDE